VKILLALALVLISSAAAFAERIKIPAEVVVDTPPVPQSPPVKPCAANESPCVRPAPPEPWTMMRHPADLTLTKNDICLVDATPGKTLLCTDSAPRYCNLTGEYQPSTIWICRTADRKRKWLVHSNVISRTVWDK